MNTVPLTAPILASTPLADGWSASVEVASGHATPDLVLTSADGATHRLALTVARAAAAHLLAAEDQALRLTDQARRLTHDPTAGLHVPQGASPGQWTSKTVDRLSPETPVLAWVSATLVQDAGWRVHLAGDPAAAACFARWDDPKGIASARRLVETPALALALAALAAPAATARLAAQARTRAALSGLPSAPRARAAVQHLREAGVGGLSIRALTVPTGGRRATVAVGVSPIPLACVNTSALRERMDAAVTALTARGWRVTDLPASAPVGAAGLGVWVTTLDEARFEEIRAAATDAAAATPMTGSHAHAVW